MRVPRWLLRQTVTVEVRRGEGAYGPVFDPPRAVRCRIEPRRRVVRDRQGQEVVSEATAYFGPEVEVTTESRVTWEGRAYEVIEARPYPGPSGRTVYVEAVLR